MLLNVSSEEDINKINDLIAQLDTMIQPYYSPIQTFAFNDDIAIGLVNAYFNVNGYKLSSELLLHAKSNKILDSTYNPLNTDDLQNSTLLKQLSNNSNTSGSSAFTKSDGDDLYYAIRGFTYTKSVSGRALSLRDRYDYHENSDTGVSGVAISWMYDAQERGVLTPFYSEYCISYDDRPITNMFESVAFTSNKRIYSKSFVLGKEEYFEFSVTFDVSGYKVFQTLGMLDTYISIYDSNYICKATNDDAGYKLNAFVLINLEANKQYKVRVKCWSRLQYGKTKLLITNSFYDKNFEADAMSSYENIFNMNSYANFYWHSYVALNHSHLVTFTPPTAGEYTIHTE